MLIFSLIAKQKTKQISVVVYIIIIIKKYICNIYDVVDFYIRIAENWKMQLFPLFCATFAMQQPRGSSYKNKVIFSKLNFNWIFVKLSIWDKLTSFASDMKSVLQLYDCGFPLIWLHAFFQFCSCWYNLISIIFFL